VEYVIESPYCNAFQPPPIANMAPVSNNQQDAVHPMYEPSFVFECKYELDSLAHFLALSTAFYDKTGSTDFLHPRWMTAVETVLQVLEEQSKPTFDPETGQYSRNVYTFQRKTDTGTETLNLKGIGNPLNSGTGLIRSAFRPSDDATILGFFIPANAMIAIELKRTGALLQQSGHAELSKRVSQWGQQIHDAVWKHGVVKHPKFGDVFAYEVDGYGSQIIMDDANYPSLLALPVMGFLDKNDEVYQNTRRMLLSREGNPYFLTGSDFKGIGGKVQPLLTASLEQEELTGSEGPHIGVTNAWPMSLLMQIQTSDDDDEIRECLTLVLDSAPLGLLHESVDVNHITSYTRKASPAPFEIS
jgi:meiotically up-regulated gene 157 (Mug157) protein